MAGVISAALIASRLLHFTALMVLFGSSLFSLYAVPRAGTPDEMELVRRLNCWLHRLVTGAAGLTLVSGVALLGCTAAAMSGDPTAAWKGGEVYRQLRDAFGEHLDGAIDAWAVQRGLGRDGDAARGRREPQQQRGPRIGEGARGSTTFDTEGGS
jgi:putative copper export protein